MKKLLAILFAAILAASTGCGAKCQLQVTRDADGNVIVSGSCDFPEHVHRD